MGEIRAKIHLQNQEDIILYKKGFIKKEEVRETTIDALVDTGAVMVLLPQDVVEQLGLTIVDKTVATLANDEKVELNIAEEFVINICGRRWITDCLVGPPLCEPLIGQLVMERLDLVLNPRKKTITVNPASPYLPHLKLKAINH